MTPQTKTTSTIQLGDPIQHEGIVVAPLFPRTQPRAGYLTFEEAAPLGFRISEIDEDGSVPELLVENPLDTAVLLYDGEELVGAKQNRILNLTVLVAPHAKTQIPVSCVERGRWTRRSRDFAPAANVAHHELRRLKAEAQMPAPTMRGIAQDVVWEAVDAKAASMGVDSPTAAQRDIFDAHQRDLDSLRRAFPIERGQAGMIVAFGNRVCLDYVSQPSAFGHLYSKLLDAAMLDAIEHATAEPPAAETLEEFLGGAETAPRTGGPSAGLGEDVRIASEALIGSGLELDGELLQLSAFSRA